MNNAIMSINATMGRDAAKEAVGIEEKVKASMKAVLEGNWMETNDCKLFQAALGGALLDVGVDTEDGRHLVSSVEMLKRFNSAMAASAAGVSVDFTSVFPSEGDELPLPLLKWWDEAKTPNA